MMMTENDVYELVKILHPDADKELAEIDKKSMRKRLKKFSEADFSILSDLIILWRLDDAVQIIEAGHKYIEAAGL